METTINTAYYTAYTFAAIVRDSINKADSENGLGGNSLQIIRTAAKDALKACSQILAAPAMSNALVLANNILTANVDAIVTTVVAVRTGTYSVDDDLLVELATQLCIECE